MKIGINTTPVYTAHKRRGIGYYTSNLLNYLSKDKELEIFEFTKLSEVENLDLVHYPWFDFYFHSLPIKKKFKRIVTIHDTIPLLFPSHYPIGFKGKINFFLQKLALKNVDAFITDSNISKRDIISKLKIKSDKIFPVPIAADKDFQPLADNHLIRAKNKFHLPDQFLLYVGDANWSKNIPFLIKGFFQLIQKQEMRNTGLVLVGDVFLKNLENIDHPELESLKNVNRLIKELGLSDKIIRPGNLVKDDLIAFYNLATVYVQPSIYEGFGLPVLEAFSCGTPVISSNTGSLPEVGGNIAIYFNSNNLLQFVRIVEDFLLNKSLQKRLSNLSLKHALNFSWEKVVEQTKKVYHYAINNE